MPAGSIKRKVLFCVLNWTTGFCWQFQFAALRSFLVWLVFKIENIRLRAVLVISGEYCLVSCSDKYSLQGCYRIANGL
ncbi:unnamed protein product [Trichobilharzia szidati]|nr:unnamed protein product [Trichobilharzia szidati]